MLQSREPIPVFCVVADGEPPDVPAAWVKLHAAMESEKGRRFYGTFLDGVYRACVASESGEELDLEELVIPGGLYASARLRGWSDLPAEIRGVLRGLRESHDVDDSRPEVEFYRRADEVVLYVPVRQ